MLLAAPTDVVALNYFFDTLLFCGAILLLANAMEEKTAVVRISDASQTEYALGPAGETGNRRKEQRSPYD